MTWALCLNCGEVKFGAICPCPKCEVASTGDMGLDIAFSDHNIEKQSLEDLGKVVAAIHRVSSDSELCFWTFIYYVSTNHSDILGVSLKPDLETSCREILSQAAFPPVKLAPSARAKLKDQAKAPADKKWWQFWK